VGEPAVYLVYSNHRVETLPRAEALMRRCRTIFLEEPSQPGFSGVLEGSRDIEGYLMETDYGFPEFARRSLTLYRQLHSEGKTLLQVEPYLEALETIHDLFADGQGPDDLPAGSLTRAVYRMERSWTAALVEFYSVSASGEFIDVVGAVQRFARVDASRGRMRDMLRSQDLAREIPGCGQVYVEAGFIHFLLLHELVRRLPRQHRPVPVYLLSDVVRESTGRVQLLGPGDTLTLRCTFRPDFAGPVADLLAARSLIYAKILEKEELLPGREPYPHTRDEIRAGSLVGALTFERCRELYERIRLLPTRDAKREAEAFASRTAHWSRP
jgi:hypothetical protein